MTAPARTIVARPDDLALRPDPDVIPLRRPDREPMNPGAPAQPRPPAAAPEVGGRDVLNALRYHSVLFVTLGTLAAGGLFAATWTLVPAKYTTYATLLVDQRNPTNMPVGPGGASEDGNFPTYLKTQANLIKNRKTIGGALLDPKSGIAQMSMIKDEEDPAAYLEDKLVIDTTDTSNSALRVTLSGDDPVQITAIVNAVVDFYMKEVGTWRQLKALRIETLEKTRIDLEKQLTDRLKHFEEDMGPGATGNGTTLKQKLRMSEYVSLLGQRGQLRGAVANARSMLKAAQAKVEQHDASPPPVPFDDVAQQQIDNDPDVRAKEITYKRLWQNREAIRIQSANPNTAKFREVDQRAAAAAAEFEEARRKAKVKIEATYRTGLRLQLAGVVEKAQDEVKRLEEMEASTAEQLAEYKEFRDLDEAGVQKKYSETVKQQDDIDNLRRDVSGIKQTLTRLRADLDAPDRVSVWHKAEVPAKKDVRKQAAASGAAGLFGFGLVGGVISLYELRRKRVYGPADPLFRQKLPLLGCLPDCAAPAGVSADAADPAGRRFFEAVDKVKAILCRQLQRRQMQAVLVTSAAPHEGKSALAWHLALSLARSDRRTLFVDGNLRNPGLHNHFDIASHPGLSELLRGEQSAQEVVQRTALENLWCIAAGVCDEAARQALDKDALRHLLDRARRDFDYVVIDACSIKEAVDPLYLAQRADATVLAVRAFQSGTADVERAADRLTQLGTPLLGAVLTDPSGAGCEL